MILARCLIGSRLYGLHNFQSDWDYMTIVSDPIRLGQKKVNNIDDIVVDLATFLKHCHAGSHQYLDVIYAQDQYFEVDKITALRHSYNCDLYQTYASFMRVYKSLRDNKLEKRRIFAETMRYKAQFLLEYGYYNPTLSEQTIAMIKASL